MTAPTIAERLAALEARMRKFDEPTLPVTEWATAEQGDIRAWADEPAAVDAEERPVPGPPTPPTHHCPRCHCICACVPGRPQYKGLCEHCTVPEPKQELAVLRRTINSLTDLECSLPDSKRGALWTAIADLEDATKAIRKRDEQVERALAELKCDYHSPPYPNGCRLCLGRAILEGRS